MTALETWQEPRPVKLTVEDFLHLTRSGALHSHGKTELIEGVIVAMNSQMAVHARIKSRLFRRIADAVDDAMPGYEAWTEASIAIQPDNVPEPDILVTNFTRAERTFVPSEAVALVIEVSDTTARYDLGKKAAIYAAGAIPEYWVVDINASVIHQLWSPTDGTYAERREVRLGDPVGAATLPDLQVATSGL